jgi:hypothetical protein
LLTLSFQAGIGLESTFGGYYLVPVGFVILILLSEIAIVEKAKTLRDLLLLGPFCLMLLALVPGGGTAYATFHSEFTRFIGSPLWLTVFGCLIFSVYFYWRHAEQKTAMIQAVLIAMIFIGPSDTRLPSLVPQNWWPLAIVGAIQFVILLKDRTALRFLIVWSAFVAALSLWGQKGDFTQYYGILPLHLLLLGALLGSILFADDLAKWLRKRLPLLMLSLAAAAAVANVTRGDLRLVAIVYIAAILAVTTMLWCWHRMKLWKWASIGCVCILCISLLGATGSLQYIQSRSAQALLVGAACFVIGGAISAAKAGLARHISVRASSEWEQILVEWNS